MWRSVLPGRSRDLLGVFPGTALHCIHSLLQTCADIRKPISMLSGVLHFPILGQGYFSLTNQATEACVNSYVLGLFQCPFALR